MEAKVNRKVFVSFLGLGNYAPVCYKSWKSGDYAAETRYAQRAIVELYPHSDIDAIVLFETAESQGKHEQALLAELEQLGVDRKKIETEIISTDVSNLSLSWKWFESLQSKFNNGDTLILDITHGFRMVPVVFSAAVAYLKRVKDVNLEAVLYASYDIDGCPIVDLKDFYSISDWTEGVGRLVDSADPSFLRQTAEQESTGSFAGLNNAELLNSIEELMSALKNVELQNIEQKARKSLDLICKYKAQSEGALEGQVLQMVLDKFQPLMSSPPLDGTYSLGYLKLQLSLVKMLAEYRLYMQAFTAMNEWLGSLGVFLMKRGADFKFNTGKDKSARKHADMFLRMLEFAEKCETKDGDEAGLKSALEVSYRTLFEKYTTREQVANLLKQSKNIRNGFNHGWTGTKRSGAPSDIGKTFDNAMVILDEILDKIEKDV